MAWSDLCGHVTVTGKRIDLATLYGLNVDHDRRGKTGLPNAATLRQMVSLAEDLKLRVGKGKGIAFHVATCAIANDGARNTATQFNEWVKEKRGAAVCYEDVVLPLGPPAGHILVHQSVAPCTRCRAGYKAWAEARGCTIIVSADDGYDQSGDDAVFVFAPTGLVFFG